MHYHVIAMQCKYVLNAKIYGQMVVNDWYILIRIVFFSVVVFRSVRIQSIAILLPVVCGDE